MKDLTNKNYWQKLAKIYAPTFLWAEGKASSIRKRLMSFTGFKAYTEWNKDSFQKFISGYGFEILAMNVVDGGLAPVGALIAVKKINSGLSV